MRAGFTMSTKDMKILTRWAMYNSDDASVYIIKGRPHNIKELFDKAMSRIDSEGGLWIHDNGHYWESHIPTMSAIVSGAEDHYTIIGVSPSILKMLGYQKVTGHESQAPDKKQLQETKDSQKKPAKLPPWMDTQHDIGGERMSGLEMFTRASVIVDSNGTSWHFTDIEFATLDPSSKYLSEHHTREIALRNIPFNGKPPEEISKAIVTWYPHTEPPSSVIKIGL